MAGNANLVLGKDKETGMAIRMWVTARLEDGKCTVTAHAAGSYQVDEDLSGEPHEREVSISKEIPAEKVQEALQKALDHSAKELERAANRETMRATLKAEENMDKAIASSATEEEKK